MDEVRVRTVRLEAEPRRLAELRAHLTDQERAREARLLRPGSPERFAAARGWLREVLAERLGIPPAKVPIATGPNGKPRLDPAAGLDDVRFNLSHSGDWALVALAEGREVGADIERHAPRANLAGLAERVFSPAELLEWNALGPEARVRAFFKTWTRKEAYAKGLGEGLGLVMRDHTLETAEEPGHWLVRPSADWRVADVEAPTGYSAAVAVVEGRDR